jgi:hypothetical protein
VRGRKGQGGAATIIAGILAGNDAKPRPYLQILAEMGNAPHGEAPDQ